MQPSNRHPSPGRDVVVVGAGFAGLSAAVALARSGWRVLVLEARSRLGGRASAFTDGVTGEQVDNGQHVLLGCYRETFAFLEAIGAADNVRLAPALDVTFIDRGGRRTRLSCPSLPPPWHLVAAVLEWDALAWRDRFAVLKMARVLRLAADHMRGRTEALPASPGETVEDWLVLNGQTRRIREMLWEPLALATLNQSPREAAAPVFARVLAEMFGGDPRAAAVALPVRPLDEAYAEPARAFIERHGGTVRTGTPARRVLVDDGGVAGVEAEGGRADCRAVVVAVPWHAVGSLFPDPPPILKRAVESAKAMRPSPIVTVNLWFDRPILDAPFVGLPGRTLQWAFDKRVALGNSASHLALVASGANAIVAQPNDELIRRATTELVDAVPSARSARLLRGTVVREPYATFSLAPGGPPRPGPSTGVPGLFLAGDWTDTGLPGTIESAVASGHRAAQLICGGSAQ